MIDLGAWASDEYKIPTQESPQADVKRGEDEYED